MPDVRISAARGIIVELHGMQFSKNRRSNENVLTCDPGALAPRWELAEAVLVEVDEVGRGEHQLGAAFMQRDLLGQLLGRQRSSASMNAISLPRAITLPTLRAPPGPVFGCFTITTSS